LRVTAGPTRRPTITPARGGVRPRWLTARTISGPRAARVPVRATTEKSARDRIRNGDGSTKDPIVGGSGGKAMPTLCPSGGDNRPAGARAHPYPEAVGFGPMPVVRLKGALAHDNSGAQGLCVGQRLRPGNHTQLSRPTRRQRAEAGAIDRP
jgi:hypothetical protein